MNEEENSPFVKYFTLYTLYKTYEKSVPQWQKKTAVFTHRWMNAKQANRSCDLSIRQDYMHLTIDNQQFRHSIWKRSQSVWLGFITLMPTWASVNLFHRPVGGVAKSYCCIQYHSSNIKVRKSLLREKSRGNPQFNFFFKY